MLNNKFSNTFSLSLKVISIIVAVTIIALYLFSFIDSNGDLVVRIHDNLDSSVVVLKMLASTNSLFIGSDVIIPNMLNGLPRGVFPSEFKIVTLLYYFFELATAYIINESLIRAIAFLGMLLLLNTHFQPKFDERKRIVLFIVYVSIATLFALLPYWSNGGLSVAGQPLVLYAFFNIKNNNFRLFNWLIFAFFVLYSSLILAGMFLLFMLSLIFVYDFFEKQKINYQLFLVLPLMSLLYLASEYRLVLNLFNPLFTSHREEFVSISLSTEEAIKKGLRLFEKGQYHAHSLHYLYLLPYVLLSSAMLMFSQKCVQVISVILGALLIVFISFSIPISQVQIKPYYEFMTMAALIIFLVRREVVLFSILLSIIVISFWGGFENHYVLFDLKQKFSILNEVQFDRFYFLLALLWFLLFSLLCKESIKKSKLAVFIIIPVIVLQLNYSFEMRNGKQKSISTSSFYATATFDEVKKYINQPIDSYKVMSIGFHPSITLYNGFYSLDGYWVNYPLTYKHQFRKIIAPELKKSEKWKKYFDNWGSRCQLMGANKKIDLDLTQFKYMGGRYIFSSYQVKINSGKGNKLVKIFSSHKSDFQVFMYEVD